MSNTTTLQAKQKYIEYLIKTGKNLPSGEAPVLIDFENSVDPIIAVTDAITEQFKTKNPKEYEILEKSEMIEDYKVEIYTTIMASGFAAILNMEDEEIVKEASLIEDPEEMLAYVFVKSQENKSVAETFTKGIFSAYYEFSQEKQFATDIRFKELVK